MAEVEQASPPAGQPAPGIDRRIEAVVDAGADLAPVAEALAARRDRILTAWLAAARVLPFHAAHPDRVVADHLPALVDSVIAVLRQAVRHDDLVAPMDDEAVVTAARSHARARFEQGLGAVDVATEFRLLRHEISRALADAIDDAAPRDVLAGQAVVDDAIDGAAAVGLEALSGRIETLREEFLATTLHDIRQPITLVTASLDLAARWLAEPAPDPERIAEVVGEAVVAAGEITTMVDTLGDATRIAMGALEPDREPASLEHIVTEAVALLDPDARARVAVTDDGGARLLGLWDPHLLRRVVLNLLGNAIKYSPGGTAIEVTLDRTDPQTGRLTIVDHGMGLAAGEAETLFERFARSDRVREGGIPGLGLGLYACRGILEAHGGAITLASDGPGAGTRAVVTLPLLDGEADDDL